jgi:hypothetical protein
MILPGAKTPATSANRILLENGLPVARIMGDELEEFSGISQRARQQARQRLPVVRQWPKSLP